MSGLTRKQYELLVFIDDRVRETGIPPSFDEMKDALDLKYKSGIHRLVCALEERGYIRRLEKRARAIEVLKLPENFAGRRSPAHTRLEVRREQFKSRADARPSNSGAVAVPLVGRIACATPIEALQNKIANVAVDAGMIGRGCHYALEVAGDTIIIQETDNCTTGEIIVALIDNQDVVLRRLRIRGDSVSLEAANPAYEIRLLARSRVKIQGRLVGLVRRY